MRVAYPVAATSDENLRPVGAPLAVITSYIVYAPA